MNRTLATVAFILLVGTVFGQEHAPTISQCQADERLWSAESLQAKSGTGFDPSIRNYPVNELQVDGVYSGRSALPRILFDGYGDSESGQ